MIPRDETPASDLAISGPVRPGDKIIFSVLNDFILYNFLSFYLSLNV